MNKELKEFFKWVTLLLAIYFVDSTFKYYIPINFIGKNAWIGALIFGFVFFLASK